MFTSNVVLVPKKDAWRECANLVVVNTCIAPTIHPVTNCQAKLGALQGSCIITVLDIKSGFHNIPIPKELQPYCGLVTGEGVCVSQVTQLDFNPAPAHFQHVTHKTLDGPLLDILRPWHSTYIDDIIIHG